MKKIIITVCAALILLFSACSTDPKTSSISTTIPTAVLPDAPLISLAPDTDTPTSAPPRVTTLGVFTKSMLTDGKVTVVPNMKFLDIPLEYRNTLLFIDDNRKLTESELDYGIVICRVYENDELSIMTVSYDEELVDKTDKKYSDAGTEYIYEIRVKNDVFYTHERVKVGDSTSKCRLEGTGLYKTSGTPYMLISYQDDIVVGLTAGSVTDIEMLKNAEISEESLTLPPEPTTSQDKTYSGQLFVDGRELQYREVIREDEQLKGFYRIQVSLSSLKSEHPFQAFQIECPDWFILSSEQDGIQCVDINADGYDDLLIDMGVYGQAQAFSCYLYNEVDAQYELLPGFEQLPCPEAVEGENLVLSHWKSGPGTYGVNKHTITADAIELLGILTQTFDPYTGVAQYTEQVMIGGSLETIHEKVSSLQITSFESWNMWDS